jgi:hypothetical protein
MSANSLILRFAFFPTKTMHNICKYSSTSQILAMRNLATYVAREKRIFGTDSSYRDLTELARELGVSVAPSTILRWVVPLAQLRAAGRRFLAGRRDLPQGKRSMDVPLPRCS